LLVEQSVPPGVERGYDLWLKLFSRASVVLLREFYSGYEDQADEFVRWRLASADDTPVSIDQYEWMDHTPLLLAPVGATAALEHNSHKVTVGNQTFGSFRAFSYSQTFNVFDLPSVSVPAGRSEEGLPIGVQVVGRPFEENTVLTAAALIEEALGA
jgi:Asp-tRNA(Asn)/Glu-tRNA(Gln) amidotransferase A subunit family amidase